MDWIQTLPEDWGRHVTALLGRPDFATRLAEFAWLLHEQRQVGQRIVEDLAIRAWELAPADAEVCALTAWALQRAVRPYQFSIPHDRARLGAYEVALGMFVTPQTTVLEVGTGTGVIAMIAARAGARHVYTCENNRVIAAAAQDVIAHNGFADVITIIPKHSAELIVGKDIPSRADLIVHDLIADDLVGMGALAVLADARARLLKPRAVAIPRAVALRGVLVGGEPWCRKYHLGEISDFDLSAFDRLAPTSIAFRPEEHRIEEALSDPAEVLRVDLTQRSFREKSHTVVVNATRDGKADGFLQWLWIDMTGSIAIENNPGAPTLRRSLVLRRFHEVLAVRRGDRVPLAVSYDDQSVFVGPAGVEGGPSRTA